MTYHELETILLNFNGATLTFPFDEKTSVFKVANKMFALVSLDQNPLRINLKCDPEDALFLRAKYATINPGYHMNKVHWNTITLDDSIAVELLNNLIANSYALVLLSISKRKRQQYGLPE